MNKYNPVEFEKKWQEKWLTDKLYKTPGEIPSPGRGREETSRSLGEGRRTNSKFYSLYSFPYPSGAGLHVGHVEGMVANDIVARYHRMLGEAVTLPMGWDSFGLPAENFAIKTGTPPEESTEKAIATFINQINHVGISVDWEKEVGAHRPNYYRWTQWIFLQLYKAGLAYRKNAPVNWCPKDQTVLANEQVINGRCERCDTEVIQKDMVQWFFKITDFADRLDKDLDKVDWPESTKIMQRNWIGKSEGTRIKFKIKGSEPTAHSSIEVFTTRVDTIFGATFLVIAPEHKLISDLKSQISNLKEVEDYIKKARNKTDLERQTQKEKTGAELEGIVAINPFNNEEIPIYVADYVLMTYGTGAIMAVPAHDERDGAFAKKFSIATKEVVKPQSDEKVEELFTDFGILINSGDYTGLPSLEAAKKMQTWLEENELGRVETTFRIRDWLVSRQRYWGCPIPIVYDPQGEAHPIDEKDLPLLLPTDVDFRPTGESPIARSESFKKQAEEKYGKGWHHEVDTMDTFVDSSWYYFRFCDAKNDKEWAQSDKVNYWLPTDLYMIGTEHIVLHLLYSRFFTKFFFDKGLINFDEPFYKMRHMGLIQGPDGRKMSKRWGNVINPDDEIKKYGADTVRMYEMFMGPLEEAKPWNDRAENGVFKFLNRVWSLQEKVVIPPRLANTAREDQLSRINKLIKKITEDIENLSFNTSIAKFMEFTNNIEKENEIDYRIWESFLKLLAPFAPFITEELWEKLGNKYSIHQQQWPKYDESLAKDEKITIAVQVNGKVRSNIQITPESTEEEVVEIAMSEENVKKYIADKPKKVIYVKNRILNLIA